MSSRTILIADDGATTRELLTTVLQRTGYQVVAVSNGDEAITYLRGNPTPSLVLLDMFMPQLDGWAFLEERGKNEAFQAIPVIIMTALGVASDDWATRLGAVGLLRKPLDIDTLLREIARVLTPPA